VSDRSEDKERLMETRDRLTLEELLTAFDEHLRRTHGVCPGTRRDYARFVRAFVRTVFADGPVGVAEIHARDVVEFVAALTCRYRPGTVELAVSALRSFFRFLRAEGLPEDRLWDRLWDAVPMVPHRRTGLVRHLEPGRVERLIASLDSSSPRGLRDRAIILCMARLGLRASEVVRLRLEDVDWGNATVRIRARKTGHGALLPLPGEVGSALAGYLQHARPETRARQVFVLHRQRVGAPISGSIVGRAVDNAVRHAGMPAPMRGANLLRHSLATDLLDHGAGLPEIADLFGHSSLATTRIYASVDVAALREVATSVAAGDVMTGSMIALVGDDIELRRGLGYRSPSQERALRAFAGCLDRERHGGPIPLELSLDWAASTASEDPCNPARRLTTVRGFLRHLSALDGLTEVPTPGLLGPTGHRTPPHVYSDQEIANLLHAADGPAPAGGLRPRCYATLFGLIACTGLRISEALTLACGDVDLTGGMLTVRAGKRGRTRLVPLHPSALAPLCDYAAEREQRYGPPGDGEAFFRIDRSDRVSYNAANSTFIVLRRRLGWAADGRTRAPRVHDLRHRMVVRRIQAWHADGVDVDRKIAVLATYLGHVEVRDVYWYLSAVPELMSIVADRFEAFAEHAAEGVS
jgi:site-specific recombinase XerD